MNRIKRKKILLFLLPLAVIVLVSTTFNSCIDQIDLEVKSTESVVVVDGLFTTQEEWQVIRIAESIDVNSQVPKYISGAKVYVEDAVGNRVEFLEEGDGNSYTAMAKAEAGKQYRLFAILPDGREITSNLQMVPDSFPIDEIVVIDTLVNFTDDSGNPQRIRSLDFYAKASVDGVAATQYLRFSPKTAYQISEITCGPFHTPKTCYFYNDKPPIEVDIFKVDSSASTVAYNSLVYRRGIDNIFGEIFALDLRLYSYNEKEYEYWENLKAIFDQDGGITDSTPGRLSGNVTASDGSEIQGQFAVVGKSRKIEIVRNSDFSTQQLPLCGIPGARPFPLPDACCACDLLSKASLEKPAYWP